MSTKIDCERFSKMRASGAPHTLVDVLSAESYETGHIEGAVSLPLETIDARTAERKLSRDKPVVVYCASVQCAASTQAADKLADLGYEVLDYKGGLEDWQKRGHRLVPGTKK